MKVIFENYANALPKEEIKGMIKKIKMQKHSHLDFSLIYPYEINAIN